jgi:hypothetical protein
MKKIIAAIVICMSAPAAAQVSNLTRVEQEPYFRYSATIPGVAKADGGTVDLDVGMFISEAGKITNVSFSSSGRICNSDCDDDICIIDVGCGASGGGGTPVLSVQLVQLSVKPQVTASAGGPSVQLTIKPIEFSRLGDGRTYDLAPDQ